MGRLVALTVICLLCSLSTVRAGVIGIYANPDCSGCTLSTAPGNIDTLYVAIHNPPEWFGRRTCGASFSLIGLPPIWNVIEVRPSSQAIVASGDPFSLPGVDVILLPGTTDPCILLYTIVVAEGPTEPDVHLRTGPGESCGADPCPVIFASDAPFDPTCECAPGGELILNPLNDACTVAVASRSWSDVRRLYK
jgi:hypothetical protein